MHCSFETIEEEKSDAFLAAGLVRYPDNLNLKDLFYFLLAPTLCYELNFPRTTRIRKRFLIKRLLEVVFGVNLVLALFQQWMIPSVTNSIVTFSQMEYIKILERLLKLAVPNHFMWLCFFYLSFHSFLNLMGELLHFADRHFYADWWNANNIGVFWRTWNLPVHKWAVRHVYIPITELGYSKTTASAAVFLISALFHEYLVSVPLQMFRVWAFLGMMVQPPLSVISRFAEVKFGSRWGNIIVWSSIILETIEEEKSDAFLAAGLVRYPDNLNLKDLFYFLLAPTLYWWNANNIGVFWRTWNLPVHKWAVRHVYIPITELGYSKTTASAAVFLISALFHEYLVSVPLQMFRVWAFLGMMVQPPLSVISRFAEVKFGSRWGNIIVWSSIILGQPLAIMMYYHDYALQHFKPEH
ncbi:hypothetical protein MSG28_002247 [Choristoneura fumiferana]|uniref:Uncharacterized protein n=2 Tax=Choristoneura fumiferana TaxID=7141 RepID=A0ACC0JUL0_CHOFU|nr:hypothetical protein MSG28_002247 [Choristoneura fumiferana]